MCMFYNLIKRAGESDKMQVFCSFNKWNKNRCMKVRFYLSHGFKILQNRTVRVCYRFAKYVKDYIGILCIFHASTFARIE